MAMRHRQAARSALLVRCSSGAREKAEGTLNVVADRIEAMSLSAKTAKSRDFR